VRTWGESGAGAAIRHAQTVSRFARSTGCGVDEASEIVEKHLSRRQFMVGAGAAAAGLSGLFADTAGASPRSRETRSRTTLTRATRSGAAPTVVIVGSGIAGLGCAYRLWSDYGIRADVYEYNTIAGGRIRTLRGYFDDDQLVEEHAEFINPEHTETLALAKSFGLTLDDSNAYPAGSHPKVETVRFGGRPWSQKALDKDWHDWAWKLFHDAAFKTAPWPVLYNSYTPGAKRFDQMSVSEWIETYIPGGVKSDFGALCASAVLDEFGGPPDENSSLNLVYLLGQNDSTPNGWQWRSHPALGGANEKWHIHGGTDLLISGLIERLPAGTVNLGEKLVALRSSASRGYVCSFESDGSVHDVKADHVVLALPFTTLRLVDLDGVSTTISPIHMRAIKEEPLGSNSKFFAQCKTRVWNADHATGNAYCGNAVEGAWDPTVYQPGKAGVLAALPGGTSALDWGSRYGLTGYLGKPPDGMLRVFLDDFNLLFPGLKDAYNGKSYYVWSPGDPHILGAYSYLKVGQYTGFNGIQGQREKNLHFAGEQTSVNFQGYVEGGLRSGYRCATEVAGKT
jgi:monoamine oxidase